MTRGSPEIVCRANRDAAGADYGVPATATKFFVSSFEYVKAPYLPMHPAFVKWAEDAGPAYTTVVWAEFNGTTLPVAVAYEINTGTRVDWLELSIDETKFVHEHIGDILVEKEKHVFHKHREILMFAEPGNKTVREVRGDLFRPKGSNTMYPSMGDPGVHLLTQGFTKNGHQSTWTVQNDKSIVIAEQAGHLPVGSVTADESVKGYAVQGPITFLDDPESRYPEAARQEFIVHVLLAVMIMPIQRPANMTKMLWWFRKLGGIVLDDAGGDF